MIAPMKKVWIAATADSSDEVLKSIAQAGVVHIQASHPSSEALSGATERYVLLDQAIRFLEEVGKGAKVAAIASEPDTYKKVLTLRSERESVHRRLQELAVEKEGFKSWGRWEEDALRQLESSGIFPRVYQVKKTNAVPLPQKSLLLEEGKEQLLVLVLQDSEAAAEWGKLVPFPARGYEAFSKELEAVQKQGDDIQKELVNLSGCVASLKKQWKKADWFVGWETARAGAGTEGNIVYWTGYVPAADLSQLADAASRIGFGYASADPSEEDSVPTLVKNPVVPGMVKPIFNLLGTVPGYRERDISLPFLLYFLVFFAILIGDAGYGLLFFLGSLMMIGGDLAKKKAPGEGGLLLFSLSAATLVWGAVTGTWFGNVINLADGPVKDFIQSLTVSPFVDAQFQTNQAFVKFFCFTLGVTHLTLGHLWNILLLLFKEKNPLKAVGQLGALGTTLALYPIVLTLVMSATDLPQLPTAILEFNKGTVFALWPADIMLNLYAAAIGVGIVILFGSQEGNFLKGIQTGLSNLLNTLLGAVGWFSDNISYIRLFAVGLAGFAIAESFNGMALGAYAAVAGNDPNFIGMGVGIFAASLILLAGHGLNLAMALLGVVVHGVRLNLLEFSGRVGIEWSGYEYRPLKAYEEN